MPGYGTRWGRSPFASEFEERRLVRIPLRSVSRWPNCASNETHTVSGGFPLGWKISQAEAMSLLSPEKRQAGAGEPRGDDVTMARAASIDPLIGPRSLKHHASDATGERWQRNVSAVRSPNGAPLASALFRSSRSNSA